MDPSIPLVKISGKWYQMVPQEFHSPSAEGSEKHSTQKMVNANCPFCRDALSEMDAIKMDACEHWCCKYCAKTGFYSKGKFYSCPLCDAAWAATLTMYEQKIMVTKWTPTPHFENGQRRACHRRPSSMPGSNACPYNTFIHT